MIGRVVIWLLAVLLLVGGGVYVTKGIAMPWDRGDTIDLELRSAEFDYFAEGVYP